MGKGQLVSFVYIGIRSGEPQPITTTEVGGESWEREEGVREEERVRRYSWQFCIHISLSAQVLCMFKAKGDERREHTPQKKCRIKTTSTLLGPFSSSAHRLLKVCAFLCMSSTGSCATASRSDFVGGLLLTLMSPLKSPDGSFAFEAGVTAIVARAVVNL